MSNGTPDPTKLCRKVAELHKRSVSPTGMFGFHATTCQGNLSQATNLWDPSWESYFRKMLSNPMKLNTEPYSHFTKPQKRLIITVIAAAGLFSPLGSFIYFPAITSLASSLNVSIEKINLTITSYMIVAGIAPAVMGNMSDVACRRLVYILTLGIYTVVNVGFAVCNNWASLSLLVLRMVQSAGSAGGF